MAERGTINPRRVGRFYDLMGRYLEHVYGDNIHYGYWDGPDDLRSFPQAQSRLTDVLIERLRAGAGQCVLDVGCGTGGPAFRLARTTGASVVGVTISRWQVATATAHAVSAGLSGTVHFAHGDVGDMAFPDGAFDAAMALETLVHISDKAGALRELRRVLRPGGRLVLCDLTRTADMSSEQREVWAGWPVAMALTGGEYAELLADAGFEIEEQHACAANVARTFECLRQRLDQPAEQLLEFYDAEMLAQARQGVRALIDVSAECLDYHILVARHPV
jgi:ubiquinone/menaquinone biosynthesis C-methylase UbiE